MNDKKKSNTQARVNSSPKVTLRYTRDCYYATLQGKRESSLNSPKKAIKGCNRFWHQQHTHTGRHRQGLTLDMAKASAASTFSGIAACAKFAGMDWQLSPNKKRNENKWNKKERSEKGRRGHHPSQAGVVPSDFLSCCTATH